MSIIEKLAETISPDIPGIDWNKIVADTGATPAQIVSDITLTTDGKTPAGIWMYQDQMDKAYLRATAAVEKLDMPWDLGTVESMKAWDAAKNQTLGMGEMALAGLKQSIEALLPITSGLRLSKEDFRAIIASTYLTAVYGFLLHRRLTFQHMHEDPAKIIEHAESVTKAFNLIDYLFQDGTLEPLKKQAVGGIPPIVAGIIVILSVAVIAAVAWAMIANKKISATNRTMDKLCEKAIATKDPNLLAGCVELSKQNQVALNSGPSGFGGDIFKWVVGGVAVYLLVMMGPPIARAMESKSRQRES